MWATYRRTVFQPMARLAPTGPVSGFSSAFPAPGLAWNNDDFLNANRNQIFPNGYHWTGTLRAMHAGIGAAHAVVIMRLANNPALTADGTLGETFEMRLGGGYTLRLRRYYRSRYPNGGSFAERSSYQFKVPYVANYLNPAQRTTSFNVAEVFTAVTLLKGSTILRSGIMRFMVSEQFGGQTELHFSTCAGFVQDDSRHFVYVNVIAGGFGSELYTNVQPNATIYGSFGDGSICWTHDIDDDEGAAYMQGPVEFYSSHGAGLHALALRYGQFRKHEVFRPDDPAIFPQRFGKTFAAYRNKAENFSVPMAQDTRSGFALVDAAGSKAALANPCAYVCAIAGSDCGDIAFVADDVVSKSNVSHLASQNRNLARIQVTLPAGGITEGSPQSPAAVLVCENAQNVNNTYFKEQDYNYTPTAGQVTGETLTITYHKIQAAVSLYRTYTVDQRNAQTIGNVVYGSTVRLTVRIALSEITPSVPAPVMRRDFQRELTLTEQQQSDLFAGVPITLQGFTDLGVFSDPNTFGMQNPAITIQAIGPP